MCKNKELLKEVEHSIQVMKEQTSFEIEKMEYFYELARNYFSMEKIGSKNHTVILGYTMFEEIIYALGETPLWILGGSYNTLKYSDHLVSKDADSVSQSIFGFFLMIEDQLPKDVVILIPITCDSMRKIANMLSEKYEVIPLDIPPVKEEERSEEKWVSQCLRIVNRLEKKKKRILTKSRLGKSVQLLNKARLLQQELIELSKGKKNGITLMQAEFLCNTYYYTEDLLEWVEQLEQLCKRVREKEEEKSLEEETTTNIMLMGSPIYFPNYKIIHLLEELKMTPIDIVSPYKQKLQQKQIEFSWKKSLKQCLVELATAVYREDVSTAYVKNNTLYDLVVQGEQRNKIDGVVYHVLKGQIDYDFEFKRYEDYFVERGIPIYRLETDYNYQDIEQIRIRIEAFLEMLSYKKEKMTRGA